MSHSTMSRLALEVWEFPSMARASDIQAAAPTRRTGTRGPNPDLAPAPEHARSQAGCPSFGIAAQTPVVAPTSLTQVPLVHGVSQSPEYSGNGLHCESNVHGPYDPQFGVTP